MVSTVPLGAEYLIISTCWRPTALDMRELMNRMSHELLQYTLSPALYNWSSYLYAATFLIACKNFFNLVNPLAQEQCYQFANQCTFAKAAKYSIDAYRCTNCYTNAINMSSLQYNQNSSRMYTHFTLQTHQLPKILHPLPYDVEGYRLTLWLLYRSRNSRMHHSCLIEPMDRSHLAEINCPIRFPIRIVARSICFCRQIQPLNGLYL